MVQAVEAQRRNERRLSPSAKARLKEFLGAEIEFMMNLSFTTVDRSLEREVLNPVGVPEPTVSKVPKNLPAHLARLCEAQILTAEQEQTLFRRMNYLKYRANALRAGLDPNVPDMRVVQRAERFLAAAHATRDQLIKSNMRLAISVVKKFVTARHSFDDLLSEGIFSLMQAVDKFDYDRGFRFSTYAYRAIARNTYRIITRQQKESARFSADMVAASAESMIDRSSPTSDLNTWLRLRATLSQLLQRLDRREQLIVRCRYALGAHRNVKTFQAIAEKLGVSKERVRQLEQRAMGKLRAMASELDLEETI